MVQQESTHGPDDRGGEAKGNGASHTLTQRMTKLLGLFLPRQYREMQSGRDYHQAECKCL